MSNNFSEKKKQAERNRLLVGREEEE